jgi:hypothetical protein
MRKIEIRQDALRTEYHTLKLRRDAYRDREQDKVRAQELSDIIERQIQSARDRQIWEQIERQLNTISDENFQKAIANLSYEEAQTLTEMREIVRERERAIELERSRNQEIGRYR